ncbi:XYL1, partial [Symbiodinium necroappetens]
MSTKTATLDESPLSLSDSAELQFGLPDDFLLPPPATEMDIDGSWGSLAQMKTGGYEVPISGVTLGAAKLAPGQ